MKSRIKKKSSLSIDQRVLTSWRTIPIHQRILLSFQAARQTSAILARENSVHDEITKRLERNSSNRDALFLWIPKSAGSSLMKALEGFGALKITTMEGIRNVRPARGVFSFGHIWINSVLEQDLISNEFYSNAFKFSIVRNPFDRTVSLFEYLKKLRVIAPTTTFSIFCSYLESRAYEPIGPYNHEKLSQLNPQCEWIKDSSGNLLCDYVGKFEDLEAVVKKLSTELDMDLGSIEKVNATKRSVTEDYYTKKEIDVVLDVYAEDFEIFGYERELVGN